jgi:hypothetical protein
LLGLDGVAILEERQWRRASCRGCPYPRFADGAASRISVPKNTHSLRVKRSIALAYCQVFDPTVAHHGTETLRFSLNGTSLRDLEGFAWTISDKLLYPGRFAMYTHGKSARSGIAAQNASFAYQCAGIVGHLVDSDRVEATFEGGALELSTTQRAHIC